VKEKIHLLHTNDIHSNFHQWANIVNILKQKRSQFEKNGEEALTFDIGDFVDRSHHIAEATLGKGNVSLLNDAGYDAVTIGNNEGITLTKDALYSLYDEANFSVLLGNVETKDGEPLPNTSSYKLFKTKQNTTIAVIGLTAPFSLFYELLGMKVNDPLLALYELVPKVKEHADVVILLSHLGLDEDRRIASEFSDIDVILGAHTHQLLEKGEVVADTLIAQCGKHGSHVGHVSLTVDTNRKVVQEKEATVYKVSDYKINKEANDLLSLISKRSEALLEEPVATLHDDLPLHWFEESVFANVLADAIKEWCNGDIGMVNAGVLLEPLQKGTVTAADLHRICPHPINPCNIALTGEELKEIILQANTSKMERLEVKGLGFRGKVMGKMAFSGVKVHTKLLEDEEKHVTDIEVHGEALSPEKTYIVSTIDMFTFGRLYPQIRNAKQKKYFMPELLRDVLEWRLKRMEEK
jgi:5'-nucleotidase